MQLDILSKRENETLNLLKKGFKNKRIAQELNLNERTISAYISKIKKKFKIDLEMNIYFLVCKGLQIEEEENYAKFIKYIRTI